jgi:transcriptional regulator with XRE-family HTH domain
MSLLDEWTGREVRCLRLARRMSVRVFARHLGVSDRMISKWEAGGARLRPRQFNQANLDESLRRCTAEERQRFDEGLDLLDDKASSAVRWCLVVDLPGIDPAIASAVTAAVRAVLSGGRAG